MKRATDLMTTVNEFAGLLMSDQTGVAVEKLTDMQDPLEAAFVIATVMLGLRRPYSTQLLAELRSAVNDRTAYAPDRNCVICGEPEFDANGLPHADVERPHVFTPEAR